ASLDADTITDNGASGTGFGVNFNAVDANTKAVLLMSGANVMSGNASGTFNFNIGAIDTAVLSLSGQFDNNNGDGLFLDLTGVTNAAVALRGPGTTFNGNTNNGGGGAGDNGDGIDIRMNGSTNGSISISGVTSINDNAGDGIHIEMTNVVNGALEIVGPTDINNSGGDGVDVTLTGTNLISGLTFPAFIPPLRVLTLGSNFATPLNGCLPQPVVMDLNVLGVVPAEAFTIDQLNIDNSAGQGISVNATATTILADSSFITNNSFQNGGGDGLSVVFNAVQAPGLIIDGNASSNNADNGFNFDFTNSPIDRLAITNNSSGFGLPVGTNSLDGIRFSLNNSDLTNLRLDNNSVANSGQGGTGHGVNFISVINSQLTGVTVSNNTITGSNGDGFRLVNPDTAGTPVDIQFSANTITDNTGTGINLALLNGAGQDLNSNFANNTVSNNAGGSGVQIALVDNRSFVGNFTGNTASQNGGTGINLALGANGNITGDFTNNTVNQNTGSGISLVTGNNANITSNFSGNTVNQNTQIGLNLVTGTNGNIAGNFTSNTVNQSGSTGINLVAGTTGSYIGNFDQNAVNQSGGIGINVDVGSNGVITSDFTTNTVNSSASHGIDLELQTGSQLTIANFYANTIGATGAGNGGMGVRIVAPDLSTFNINMGDAAQAANNINFNRDSAVGVRMTGASNGVLNIANSSLSNTVNGADANFNGEGLAILQGGSSVVTGS
ncbi:MAG: hypothetical protein FJ267_06015, partial [Planctomycetes bacterium]|nr:hypothetical protein [Planctomycetota bacterium]